MGKVDKVICINIFYNERKNNIIEWFTNIKDLRLKGREIKNLFDYLIDNKFTPSIKIMTDIQIIFD